MHAIGSGCLDVVLTVVSEDTFLGAETEAAADDVIYLALGLDDVLLRRDDASVEEAEDGELLHGLMDAAAPVGETVETISFCLEAGEEIAHAGYLAEDELGVVGAELRYLLLPLRHGLLHVGDDLGEGARLAVEPLVPLIVHEVVVELL